MPEILAGRDLIRELMILFHRMLQDWLLGLWLKPVRCEEPRGGD
jgi:hypothetical protein